MPKRRPIGVTRRLGRRPLREACLALAIVFPNGAASVKTIARRSAIVTRQSECLIATFVTSRKGGLPLEAAKIGKLSELVKRPQYKAALKQKAPVGLSASVGQIGHHQRVQPRPWLSRRQLRTATATVVRYVQQVAVFMVNFRACYLAQEAKAVLWGTRPERYTRSTGYKSNEPLPWQLKTIRFYSIRQSRPLSID